MTTENSPPPETLADPFAGPTSELAWSVPTEEYPTQGFPTQVINYNYLPSEKRWPGRLLWMALVTLLFAASVATAWFLMRVPPLLHTVMPTITPPVTVSITAPPLPAPPPLTVTPPPITVTPPPQAAPAPVAPNADDQRMLNRLVSHGYVIDDPIMVLGNAHAACVLMQQDLNLTTVYNRMTTRMGLTNSVADQGTVALFVGDVQLSYPNCYPGGED
jgi:hypothetical protein